VIEELRFRLGYSLNDLIAIPGELAIVGALRNSERN
jgi:hypothetical protein